MVVTINAGVTTPKKSEQIIRIKEYLRNESALKSNRFRYEEVDLNNDGQTEIILFLDICGSGGCTFLFLSDNNTHFKPIQKFTVVRLPMYVEPETVNGWKILIMYSDHKNRLLTYDVENGYPDNAFSAPVPPSNLPSIDALELFPTEGSYFTPENSYLVDVDE